MQTSTPSLPRAAGQAAQFSAGPVSFNGHLHTCTILGLTGVSLFLQSRAGTEALENHAAFIVRACNSYAGLVTFAERVASWDGNPEAMSVTVRAELIRQAVELNSALNSAK